MPAAPATSIGYAILEDVQLILQRAGLVGVNPAEIKVRELPTVNEELDHTPCVFLCPYKKITTEAADMEGSALRKHGVEICLVDATDGDFATNQKKRQTWHEQAQNAIDKIDDGADGIQFRCGLPHVPEVWGIEIVEAPTFDRSKLSSLYSYQSVVVNFLTSE
jgi:hypothetical protein